MSTTLLGLGLGLVTAHASDGQGLQRALVATAVTAGAEGVSTVAGALLGVVASPVIGDRSGGVGYQVGSSFVRGGTTGIAIGTLGGGFVASHATDTPPLLVGGVSAGVGLAGLAISMELDQTRSGRATGVAIVGTLIAVPVVAGVTAGFAEPRHEDDALSLRASPAFSRDGGGILVSGRF
ncbi:MAG: hypothetical protein ABMA64_36790 [Myxococcota bacterium]